MRFYDRDKTERVSIANRRTQLDVGHVVAAPNTGTCRFRLPKERNYRDGACAEVFGICQGDLRRGAAEWMAGRLDDVETIETWCRHRLGRSTWPCQYADHDQQGSGTMRHDGCFMPLALQPAMKNSLPSMFAVLDSAAATGNDVLMAKGGGQKFRYV